MKKEFKSRSKIGKALQNNKIIHCIYLMLFEDFYDNFIYVGSSRSGRGFFNRTSQHLRSIKNGTHDNWKLKRRYKHNKNIYFQIIEIFDYEQFNDFSEYTKYVLEREQYWIDKLDCVDNGYNVDRRAWGFHKDSNKEILLKRHNELLDNFEKLGYYCKDGDKLYNWLMYIRRKENIKSYNFLKELVKNTEHEDMYELTRGTTHHVKMMKYLIENFEYPNLPKHNSEIYLDKQCVSLITILINRNKKLDYVAEKNLKNTPWEGFLDKLQTYEQKGIKKLNEICDFIDKNGVYPKRTIKPKTFKEIEETKLAEQLIRIRGAKKEYSTSHFYPVFQQIADERGYPNLFDDNSENKYKKKSKEYKDKMSASKIQTHCKRGHEFNEENTYLYTRKDGRISRYCKECQKMKVKNNDR